MDSEVLSRVVSARIAEGWPAGAAGWRLAFSKGEEGETGRSVTATIIRDKDCRVYGVIYRLGLNALRRLDVFEGVPDHYERERIWVEPLGRRATQAAVTYVARQERLVHPGRPDPGYIGAVLRGARAHRLPDDYVTWLDALAGGRVDPCYRGGGVTESRDRGGKGG